MPWFSTGLELPTTTGNTVRVDRIDMRLEDLRKYGGVRLTDMFQWLAPLPGGRFLTHDHGVVLAATARSLGWPVLPADWWEYAAGTFGGVPVKAPKYPRDGEQSQAELDTGVGQASFIERLERL